MISPDLLERLEQKSQAYGMSGNSWEGYAIVLRFLSAALERVPSLEALETCEIDDVFGTELEHLALLVVELFPREPFEELSTFLRRS